MARRYYSSRTKPGTLTLQDLYWKIQNLYLLFRDKDSFKQKAGITSYNLPAGIKHEAARGRPPKPVVDKRQEAFAFAKQSTTCRLLAIALENR